jgi:hypothetical protein
MAPSPERLEAAIGPRPTDTINSITVGGRNDAAFRQRAVLDKSLFSEKSSQ